MKISRLVGERIKDNPSEAQLASHKLLLRGGYIKQLCNGIFSLLPPAVRIETKIEQIIREEMDKLGCQEVKMPVVMPASLWQESGRYESIGSELLRFSDRNESPLLLGMTHEEAAVHLVREYANSYQRYPFAIYQIQTKFRDEPRSRGGLIRLREFTMKDAYSFHTSYEDLATTYQHYLTAYHKIFERLGLGEVIAVQADAGMMGGSVSHEFMLLCDAGEDSIVTCTACDYKANSEVAKLILPEADPALGANLPAYEEVATPNTKTIADVAAFFNTTAKQLLKAVVYEGTASGKIYLIFIRGDLEVNEVALRNYAQETLIVAKNEHLGHLALGYLGPHQLPQAQNQVVLFDQSAKAASHFIVGANKEGFHGTNFSLSRDYALTPTFIDVAKVYNGAPCPQCGQTTLKISRGIEVGNIFQLRTKYSETMKLTYLDDHGAQTLTEMGCYGIGISRILASVCEVSHDDYGPIWPITIAPWQIHLCALNAKNDEALKTYTDSLYAELLSLGLEVIYDDRPLRPGSMFADADLLGVPYRVIVGAKNFANGQLELVSRDKTLKELISTANAASYLEATVKQALKAYPI